SGTVKSIVAPLECEAEAASLLGKLREAVLLVGDAEHARQVAETIRFADEPDELAVLDHGQAADAVREHHLYGPVHGGVRSDREHVRRHRAMHGDLGEPFALRGAWHLEH